MPVQADVSVLPQVIAVFGSVIVVLFSILLATMNRRLTKVEEKKVDHGHCKMTEKLAAQEFAHGKTRMDDLKLTIADNHGDLKVIIEQIQKDQRGSVRELANINKCLALLSEKISCEPKG